MELRVLRYFLAVAGERTITAAAERLHLTQPTLSRQIHDLERELGQRLLVRGSHRVELTEAGMLLRRRAEELVALADKTESELRGFGSGEAGDVYIGCGETQVMHLLAEAARELRERCPSVRFHLFSGNYEEVTERLDKGLLDFGVLIEPFDIARYASLSIPERESWQVLMRRDSPLAALDAVRREDLADKPLIFSRQVVDAGPTDEYRRWFGDDFGGLDVVATFNLVYNASFMVEQGMGYALTIGRRVDASEQTPLTYRPLEPSLTAELAVVWKRGRTFSQPAVYFLEQMEETFDRARTSVDVR